MINYLPHKEIDFDKWDHCIENSLNGIIYPYTFYLNQVSPGWDALVLDDYHAVMPLTWKKKKGFHYIYQPFFVQQLGVFSTAPISQELVHDFLLHIPDRFRFINYNLNTHNRIEGLKSAKVIKRVTYELDLISPYEKIKNNYSKNTRRNLSKALKSNVFVTKNSSPDIIIESFRKHRGREFQKIKESHYNTLKHLIYSGIHRGNAVAYSAYNAQNSFCAGVVFLHSHKKSILIFSGRTPEALENGAMTAIIDRYIHDYAEQNMTLDFEGSEDKNLARFYSGFGSKECVYLQVIMNNFPLLLKPFANLYYWLRKQST